MTESRRFGFGVVRTSGHRSTYDWWDKGDPRQPPDSQGFVVIRHYLPSPVNPIEGDFLNLEHGAESRNRVFMVPNVAHPLEAQYSGIAISLEDWPEFLRMMAAMYADYQSQNQS